MMTQPSTPSDPFSEAPDRRSGHYWSLLTNHAACLLLCASRNSATLREIAAAAQITERSAARIVADLRADGYLAVHRHGRRNRYAVNLDAPLRDPVADGRRVVDLFAGLLERLDQIAGEDTPFQTTVAET